MEKKYRPLDLDFEISDSLKKAIDDLIEYLNSGKNVHLSDGYRSEVLFYLKENRFDLVDKITDEQYEMLKDYYVHGDIYRKWDDTQ